MRTKEALRNTIVSMFSYVLIILTGFISQRIFKDILGQEYLGLHGLFSNIMTMLGIVELGFGSAIVVNMYKPVAEHDISKIIALLQYYKKVYRVLAIIVMIIGMAILPCIGFIVGETTANINIRFVFTFYLVDTISSYFVTYKRSIIYANQKSYYTNVVHTIMVICMNITQIILLLSTQNYYGYLALRIVFRLLENIAINIVANKKYPYIVSKTKYSLDMKTKMSIKQKVKGLLFHKIGTFLVLGSDNIIISMLPNLGLVWVGLYSNYLLILNQLKEIVRQIFSAITASIGNLLVNESKDKSYGIFRKLLYFNAWIYTYISISFYFVSFPFIELWMKDRKYLFSEIVVMVLTINLFIQGMRMVYNTFKEAAGIFYEDRFIPIIESIVNIVVSVWLGSYWGIVGVFVGTICSNMVLFVYSFPRYVYGIILGKGVKDFIRDLSKYVLIYIVSFSISYIVAYQVDGDNVIVQLILNIVICFVVTNGCFVWMTRKSEEFMYAKNIGMKYLKKVRRDKT